MEKEIEDKVYEIENKIKELDEKIIRINNSILGKLTLRELENKNINFHRTIVFDNPIILSYQKSDSNNIGYQCSNNIEEDLSIETDKEILLLSLNIPSCGVWFIKYRLEMNLSIGFSALKFSKIVLNLNSEDSNVSQIVTNYNSINYLNQILITNSDSTIIRIEDNVNVNIFVNFCYGKVLFPDAVLKINKNNNFPILSATRIC